MAQPTTLKSSKFLIEIGDGAVPEVFSAPCSLTTSGLQFTNTPAEFQIPDCLDREKPIWVARTIQQQSAEVTGEGLLAMEDWPIWREWELENGERNIRVHMDAPPANNGGYWEMSAVLASLNLNSPFGELTQISVSMLSNGEPTWVDAT